MSTVSPSPSALADMTLEIIEELRVHASIDDTFAALLAELGPDNQMGNGQPMPMVLEAWPGGRWFRDLGNGNGHWWGQVQAIRVPTLLEIHGPLMMSFPVASNVQYRLRADGTDTIVTLRHSAFGLIPDGFKVPFSQGWKAISTRLASRFPASA